MGALLRKVDSIRSKELGRRTGRGSSPMEQTPQPKLVPGKKWGKSFLRDSESIPMREMYPVHPKYPIIPYIPNLPNVP